MSFERTGPATAPVAAIVAAALVLALTTSARGSWGLFIGPINSAGGFGPASVSLAIAAGALAWGAALPAAGWLARRIGAPRLLAIGGLALAAVTALVPFASHGAVLVLLLAASGIAAGHLMQRVPMKSLLAGIYALRALGVLAFVALPKSEAMLLAFALSMGLTSSATLPPTSGLVTQLFGARNVATLFGFTLFVHQVGSFLGAWLGGIELEATGGYALVWWIDVALAAAAALAYLPVREARDRPPPAALAAAASR